MTKLRLAVVTATRAEYGHMRWIIRRAHEDRAVRLQLIAAGMHLERSFGRTIDEIRADGIPVTARIPLPLGCDTELGAARAIGAGTSAFAAAFHRLRPDVLLVLGDRYELLAAVPAAAALGIPVAHLHGGEATEGVFDELVRHAVTKLSYLHLTAAEPYRRRVIQMGEHPSRVINVGAPGLEGVERLERLNLKQLEDDLRFPLDGKVALVTYHPETPGAAVRQAAALFSALRSEGIRAVATYANADAGGRAVNAYLRAQAGRRPAQVLVVPSLGRRRYLSLMAICGAVVGNSSSGIVEAPALFTPSVNIGDRQAGRLRAPSVIDCVPEAGAIARALRRAFSPAFRRDFCRGESPYRGGRVSTRVLAALKGLPRSPRPLRKSFYELPRGKRQ